MIKGIIRLNVNKGGEILLRIRVESHPLFQRDGDDLHIAIPVSVVVAALGGHVEAPNIAGGRIKIAIPPETQSGRVLRLRGARSRQSAPRRMRRYAVSSHCGNAGKPYRRTKKDITTV